MGWNIQSTHVTSFAFIIIVDVHFVIKSDRKLTIFLYSAVPTAVMDGAIKAQLSVVERVW